MPFFLLIETGSSCCSIAIANGDTTLSRYKNDGNNHAEYITLGIEHCLSEANIAAHQLDAIAINGGPGSYTGLRIGLSTAKGLCYALNKPLIMVDALQSLYNGLKPDAEAEGYCTTIDNRRNELFYALFDNAGNQLSATQLVTVGHPIWHELNPAQTVIAGSAIEKLRNVHPSHQYIELAVNAEYLLPTAREKYNRNQFDDVAYCEPLYYKDVYITPQP